MWFDLTIRASDGTQTTDAAVTVTLADVPEAPAFGQASYEFSLAENVDGSVNRVSLGVVAASDADNDAVEYRIAAGTARACSSSTLGPGSCSTWVRARTSRLAPRGST